MQENTRQKLPIWQDVRKLFPALRNCTYLNTASRGIVSSKTIEAVQNYYEELSLRGDRTLDDWLERSNTVRCQLASFIGAACEEIAFLSNSSLGMNFAAQLFADAGEVVTIGDEFPSVTLPWLQRAIPVKFVKSLDGTIRLEDIERSLGENTKLLVTSYVQYSTGFRHNLAELGKFCRDRGLIFIVDATQGFGAFPIHVEQHQIDVLVFSGYKWATAGYGIAGLYIRNAVLESRHLPAVGWRSAKHPRRMLNDQLDLSESAIALELGHPPFAGIVALGAALDLVEEIEIETIESRIFALTDYLHHQIHSRGIEIISTTNYQHRSGITIVAATNPQAIAQELKKRQIIVSATNKGLRVSLHFYNNADDVERLLRELVEISAKKLA